MQDKFLRESRRLDALAQVLCSAAALFEQKRDKEAAITVSVLSKLILQQLDVMDHALHGLAKEAQHEGCAV